MRADACRRHFYGKTVKKARYLSRRLGATVVVYVTPDETGPTGVRYFALPESEAVIDKGAVVTYKAYPPVVSGGTA